MARPWIEYLFSQKLPWQSGLYGGARGDVESKVLSIDRNAGDSSTIIRYPARWQRDVPEALTAEEEMYVLDGEIEINGHTYTRDTYACFPAGHIRENALSDKGCVALTFFDSIPMQLKNMSARTNTKGLIEYLDTYELKWDSSVADPALEWMGNRRKVLKWDPEYNQKATFIFSTPPQIFPENWACPTLTHPCVEEAFMLAGELTGPLGRMTAGSYFWRPEGKPHGPYGTRDGGFSLIRFKYGQHINVWGDKDVPYALDVPYKPILPEEMKVYGKDSYDGPERY